MKVLNKMTVFAPVRRLWSLQRSCTSIQASRSILSNAGHGHDDSQNVKTMSEVIQELTANVIGGPASWDPDEYNRRRQELTKLLPASQVRKKSY
jgi:hypothetical protein